MDIQREKGVAWVWFTRGDSLNAIDAAVLDELRQIFTDLNNDDSVRVIVLAGRGRAFCAGFDVKWFASLTPEMFGREIQKIGETFALVENSPKPLICAVQGAAAGAGIILTTYCDFIIAAENAKFTAPEVKLSIFPGLNLIPRLERMVGMQHAKRFLLLGEPITAAEAFRIGMLDRVVLQDHEYHTLYRETQELAEKLAANPPIVTQAIKTAFDRHTKPMYAEWEMEKGMECWSQPEREQTLLAFLNKGK